jgi:ATP-binding cassette subfamily C (CFTR/MRP) protein 1
MDWLHVSQFLFSNFVPWPYLKALTNLADTPPVGHPNQGRHFEITCRLCLRYQTKFNISTLLAVSFKANLDPFDASTNGECRNVLEMVDLWQVVQEQGGLGKDMSADALSQDQKQLFSLARAILRQRIRSREARTHFAVSRKDNKTDIALSTVQNGGSGSGSNAGGLLLLDEVSSSVDRDTDQAMQTIIKREFANYTIVMVSHRLDMAIDFDKVLIMDKGSIIKSGNPRKLIEREGSSFKELWAVGRHQI